MPVWGSAGTLIAHWVGPCDYLSPQRSHFLIDPWKSTQLRRSKAYGFTVDEGEGVERLAAGFFTLSLRLISCNV